MLGSKRTRWEHVLTAPISDIYDSQTRQYRTRCKKILTGASAIADTQATLLQSNPEAYLDLWCTNVVSSIKL